MTDKIPRPPTNSPKYSCSTPEEIEVFYEIFRATRGNLTETARRLTMRFGHKVSRHVVARIVEDNNLFDRLNKDKIIQFSSKEKVRSSAPGSKSSPFNFVELGRKDHAEVVTEFRQLVGAQIKLAKSALERLVLAETYPDPKVGELLKLWELYQSIVSEDERLQAIARRKKGHSRITASYEVYGAPHTLRAIQGGKSS